MKYIYIFLKVQLALILITSVVIAQPQINQSFSPGWSASLAGWPIVNNSSPIGTSTWGQGNSAIFPAANGPSSGYLGILYLTASQTAPATISNFLITPTVSLSNGQTIQFATRTGTNTLYADRLQLRMSTQGSSTFVGTGATSVGDFTDLLLDINPLLNLTTASVVSNGTVNGYPDTWTVYTTTLSGITGTVTGRFAFRYFVTNAGLNGINGNYIGIDDVYYSAPCIQPSLSILPTSSVTCINTSMTFSAVGCNTYTWSSPSGTTTTNPLTYTAGNTSATITFTVSGRDVSGCKSESVTVTQQISNCTGLLNVFANAVASAFPNPFTNEINLKNFSGTAQLYNSMGQLLITVTVSNSSVILANNLPDGFYMLKLLDSGNNKAMVLKLLKQ